MGEWVNRPTEREALAAGTRASYFASSPGLFGSFPWVDNDKQYAAFLLLVNLKNRGRGELYRELKTAVDKGLE